MNRINFQPLQDFNDDKLGFESQCSEISNFIEVFPNNQPYSIAIFGKWGSGKSTMLNFIENKLNKQNNIIIRFNPWQILNETNLVPTLFEEIAYSIQNKEFLKLKKSLLSYGRKICASSAKIITKSILSTQGVAEETSDPISEVTAKTVDTLFNSDNPEPLSIKKRKLEKELLNWSTKEDKKIIVFIDEIDRLFPSDIIEIFKVIKVAISFPSIIFIVAMDREAVNDSLSSINITKPDEYLSKIFQQRFYINSNYQLRTLFKEMLIPLIDKFPESPKISLLYAIDIIIFLKQELFILPSNPQDDIQNKAKGYYFDVYKEVSLYLSIPRSFVNYISFILTSWVPYYNQLSKKNILNDRDKLTIFIIFTLYYIHPELVENQILGNRSNDERVDYPRIFKEIRYKLFNVLFEQISTPIEGRPGTQRITYDDTIIRSAIYTLKKYPDLKEYFEKKGTTD